MWFRHQNEKKEKGIDNYTLFLICAIAGSVVFILFCSGMCDNKFDEFLFFIIPSGIVVSALFFKKFRLLG